MKEQILKELFQGDGLRRYAYKVCEGNDFHYDLIQEVYLYLSGRDESFIIGLHERGELSIYVCRVIYYSWKSQTSPFYKKYRVSLFDELKGIDKEDDSPIEEDIFDYTKWINKIESDIKDSWYNGKVHTEGVLMLKYLELGSYREVAKEMDIPHTTVQAIVQRYAKKLKDE